MIFDYFIHLLIIVGIYIILSSSLNLVLGYTGLLNLGHVALFGIGAYASALFALNGMPFVISFFLAGVIASIFGFLLALVTKKLKGDFYALAALGFAFVVYSLFLNLTGLTNGPLGLVGIPNPEIIGIVLKNNLQYFFLVSIVAAFSVFVLYRIVNSHFGKLLEAMRDDELRVRALGKDTFKLKCKAAAVSAFFAGIAGSLFAHYIRFVSPESFYLSEIILIITIVIVGGVASLKGSVLASFIILLVPEGLRFLQLPSSAIGPARQMIYALILLMILAYKPRGLCGRIDLE